MKKNVRRTPPHNYMRQRNRRIESETPSRLGNQLSISVILCIFFMIISLFGGKSTEKIRNKASEVIGKNALENFEPQGSLQANFSEFINCMFNYGDESDEEIEKDMLNEKDQTVLSEDLTRDKNIATDGSDDPSNEPPPE